MGGMGEVYRARDTKLGRDVAIKVLPETFAQDPERLARFEREAKLLAALNHRGIATLYGFEETNGKQFLVMELVEGNTLAERIAKGTIPVDEAVVLFVQIAEALEFAHEKGIVHRDLKPPNIKIGPDDEIKILDFGLAKAYSEEKEPADGASQSPTLTKGTALGAIMGTASYMSPEQARGKSVDRRADIWAFGCCLYEALTGKKAFEGETITDTLAAVVKNEPDWERLPSDTPSSLRALLKRCLRKDAKRRLRDMGDARVELEEPSSVRDEMPKTTWAPAPWVLVGLLAVLSAWLVFPRSVPPSPLTRFVLQLPVGARFPSGPQRQIDIAGTNIVYLTGAGNDSSLYMQKLDAFAPVPIANTRGARGPFFSADGAWIGFFAAGRLQKVAVTGGTPVPICDARPSPGASWGEGGTIVFADGYSSGLLSVSADGGEPRTLTTPDREAGETGHRWPQLLPGGKAILFTVRTHAGSRIVVQSLETGERKTLVEERMGATDARYISSGHLLYDLEDSLVATPFDLNKLELAGAPASVVEDVSTSTGGGLSGVAVSNAGVLVYLPASVTYNMASVQTLGTDRRWVAVGELQGDYHSLALSPDGRQLALTIRDPLSGIWLYDMSRESLAPLALGGRMNQNPTWTPDGRRITFSAGRVGHPPNPYWMAADGSDEEVALLENMELTHPPFSWSPDGEVLAYGESGDIRLFNLDGLDGRDGTSTFTNTPFRESFAKFSPDGRWIAYASDESGKDEVYITSYPRPGAKPLISTDGGTDPVWAPDGRRLFYLNGNQLMQVAMSFGETIVAGVPELVVEGDIIDYDVYPDGERIIAIRPEGSGGWNRLNVVLNWFPELERLVPAN